ncbi:hypothetical protein EJ07DRAFT_159094 [Lizonia empirigonia]|nr:hypothetical protein EJ07DRAFT_159094 [Lizonia empirigonia]
MFKPLSTAYKRHLTDVLHNSQGLLQIRKGDFFPIFWAAWKDSFTVANIQKSFEATGIEPKDPGVVLQRFTHTPPPDNDVDNDANSIVAAVDMGSWRSIQRLLSISVKDIDSIESKKLSEVVHNLQAQYQLQQDELLGLKQALTTKKKLNKPNRILELEKPQEDEGESQFFTPSKFDHARDLHTAKEQQKRDKEAKKVMNQQLRDANKAYKLKIHQEKLEARRVAKVEREQRKAEEVAERQRKKETQEANCNAQKALQLPQTGKRKA